ncbi:MAG: Holliday junction resolvase RuvX [Patescibacteria group bacterium]
MPAINSSALALDVGSKRIGLAIASLASRLPRPLKTLENDADFVQALQAIIDAENVEAVVVGLPRGLDGQATDQTGVIKAFADQLKGDLSLPIHFQDEAVTSRQAEDELKSRGKPYSRGDIDALAATYILQDFLAELDQHAEHKETVA